MTGWNTFEASSLRIREAIKAGTMDARDDWHFTWTPLLLDRIGWQTIVAGIDGLSRHVAAEQVSAQSRMARSGEKPFPATVVLAAFESPPEPDQACPPGDDRRRDPIAVPPETMDVPPPSSPKTQALSSPLRLEIIDAARKRELSPASFVEERGGGSALDMSHHFEALCKQGWISRVEPQADEASPKPAGRLYRLSAAPVFDTDLCAALPSSLRAVIIAWFFKSYAQRVREAMEAGTLDAREDRRYSCTPVLLDGLGWKRLIARTDALFHFLFEVQAGAKYRLPESDEEPFSATVALAVFESPGGPRKPPRQLGDRLQATPGYSPATRVPTLRLLK